MRVAHRHLRETLQCYFSVFLPAAKHAGLWELRVVVVVVFVVVVDIMEKSSHLR